MMAVQPPIWPSAETPLPPEQRSQAGEDCPCADPATIAGPTAATATVAGNTRRKPGLVAASSVALQVAPAATPTPCKAEVRRDLQRRIGLSAVLTRQRSHIASEHPQPKSS